MAIAHSVNAVAFGPRATVSEVLAAFGPGEDFSLVLPAWLLDNEPGGWDAGLAQIRKSGRGIASLLLTSWFSLAREECWPAEREALSRVVRAAAEIGAPYVYGTTGPAGHLEFDEMAGNLARAVAPVRELADALGVRLLLESTNPLRTPINAVFSFRDLLDLCDIAGTGPCVDLTAVASERDIAADLERHAADIPVAQIGDLMPGTTVLGQRAVPSDGDLPLERLLGALVRGGFDGVLDLEAFGPRVDEEGAAPAMLRGHGVLRAMLTQLTRSERNSTAES